MSGEQFIAKDKAWTLGHITPGHRKAMSQWAKLRARLELYELKDGMSADHYRTDSEILSAAMTAGKYDYGSPYDPKAMGEAFSVLFRTVEAQAHLTCLLLKEAHGAMDEKVVIGFMAEDHDEWERAFRAALDLPPNSSAPSKTKTTGQTKTIEEVNGPEDGPG